MRRAHAAAETLRDKGDNVHGYKCPYVGTGKRHFHVGHSGFGERYLDLDDDEYQRIGAA